MKVTLIEPRGFCFGVQSALKKLDSVLEKHPYVLHEIIHNKQVVAHYKEKGVVFVNDLKNIPKGAHLVLSAHGVSRKIEEQAQKNFVVTNAVCPFVKKNHCWALKLEEEETPIVLIGQSNHIEIIGTLGRLSHPEKVFIVSCVEDVEKLPNLSKVGVVTQTTFDAGKTKQIMVALHKKYRQVLFQRGICKATEERQQAVRLAAKKHQMILVVGDKMSSNANRLVEVAKNAGADSILIETEKDLENIKFPEKIAITAAASAPEEVVARVVAFLRQL